MLHDVTQRHVFFIHHGNQRHWVDAVFAKLMTSTLTSHSDFRFATVDSIVAAHPCFGVEQVLTKMAFCAVVMITVMGTVKAKFHYASQLANQLARELVRELVCDLLASC